MLALNTTMAPLYLVNTSLPLAVALDGAQANTSAVTPPLGFAAPPIIMLSTNASLPGSATTRWSLVGDAMITGPPGARDATRPGSPTNVALDMGGRAGAIGLPEESAAATLFLQRLTLRGLPRASLSQAGVANADEGLTYALPLWTFAMDGRWGHQRARVRYHATMR